MLFLKTVWEFVVQLWNVHQLINIIVLQLLAFLQGLFTFYHEGYELAHEFEPYKQQLQFNLQNVSLISSRGKSKRNQAHNQSLHLIITLIEQAEISQITDCYCSEDWCFPCNPFNDTMPENTQESVVKQPWPILPTLWFQSFQLEGTDFTVAQNVSAAALTILTL